MEHESSPKTALYDFLYFDSARARRYCAQLFDDGVLASQVRLNEVTESLGYKAGITAAVLSGKRETSDTVREHLHQQYDTTDLLPLLILEGLKSYASLSNSVESTQLGKLFLVEGYLKIIDIRSLRGLWEPSLELFLNQAADEMKGAPGGKSQARRARIELEKQSKGMLGILQNLPNTIHMWLSSGDAMSWSTLNPENMLVNADDILLKHGTHMPGEWTVLGILDAIPSGENVAHFQTATGLLQGMEDLIAALRLEMGRKPDAYGVTPIAIYRDSNR